MVKRFSGDLERCQQLTLSCWRWWNGWLRKTEEQVLCAKHLRIPHASHG